MPKILVAPLDWGLGHATRCIPIIRELVHLGCEVTIAASGQTQVLLQKEFPELSFLSIRGYGIRYGKCNVLGALFIQLPQILRTLKYERQWLAEIVQKEKFDAIISDNRPGLHHPKIPSVYITHQLQIESGMGKWANLLLLKLHKKYYQHFHEIWVPDLEAGSGLAGRLSHPRYLTENVYYIGPLTRFRLQHEIKKNWDLLILLSGPEPQRSLFEHVLLHQLKQTSISVLLVRGLPGKDAIPEGLAKNITVRNHLSATELEKEIAASSLILCRSGYTTVMDLVFFQKKAVLVPTPGQTEQIYLAKHLLKNGAFPFINQKAFSLEKAIEIGRSYPYKKVVDNSSFGLYKNKLYDWVEKLKKPTSNNNLSA